MSPKLFTLSHQRLIEEVVFDWPLTKYYELQILLIIKIEVRY